MLAAILCFANLKLKRAKYRMLCDIFKFSTPKLCKNMWIQNYTLKCRAKLNVSDFIADKKTRIFKKGRNIRPFKKNIYGIYEYKKHYVLSIHVSGFIIYRSNMDMANNYVLLCSFLWPCSLVCLLLILIILSTKNSLNIMSRDEYVLHFIVPYIIRAKI